MSTGTVLTTKVQNKVNLLQEIMRSKGKQMSTNDIINDLVDDNVDLWIEKWNDEHEYPRKAS